MHTSVLLQESIDGLLLKNGSVVVDGTLGGGGHSFEIVKRISPDGILIGLDRDVTALARAKERLAQAGCRVELLEENFRNLDIAISKVGVSRVDAILLDIGVSSFQLDDVGRGFSFRKDEPLNMSMEGEKATITAYDVVNTWSEESLADIIWGYGEERFAKRIAKAIISFREKTPIETTGQLAEIVSNAFPAKFRKGKIHPATKTFQAIRIAVNDELGALEVAIPKAIEALSPKGILAIISFHSLEDRIVKNSFKEFAQNGVVKILTKKPLVPSESESAANPRARSAKLRIIQKV